MAKPTRNRKKTQQPDHQQTPELTEVASLERDAEIFQGFLNVLENPDKVLRLECGGDISVYDDISRDSRIGSVLRTRSQAVVGKEWDLFPASDDAQDMRIAEYTKQVFLGFPFDKSRRSILRGGILKGHALSEIMWDQSEGDTFITGMQHRAQRRFRFDLDDNLRLLTSEDPLEGVNCTLLHPFKFQRFVFGDEAETSYGVGLGRELYWPWWFKKNGIKFWLMFCERFGAPTAIGKHPSTATEPQKATLLAALDAMKSTSSIIMPEGMSVDLIQAAKSGGTSTQAELVKYMDEEATICVLGQSGTTQGTAGKLGNDQAQADVREDLIKADADSLCEYLNQGVIRWLVDYQFPGHGRYPKMWIRAGDEADLNKLAERDKTLGEAGVKFKKNYFVGNYGLEEDEFELAEEPKPTKPVEFAETETKPDTADVISGMLSKGAQPAIDEMLDRVAQIVAKADSLEEINDRLLDLYGDLDTKDLGELFAQALTLSNLAGRDEVLNGD